MFKSSLESCVTFVSEVWTINKAINSRISAVENSYWNRCCGLTLHDHVKNDTIRQIIGIQGTIVDTIERKQLLFYDYMKRMKPNF